MLLPTPALGLLIDDSSTIDYWLISGFIKVNSKLCQDPSNQGTCVGTDVILHSFRFAIPSMEQRRGLSTINIQLLNHSMEKQRKDKRLNFQ